MCGRMRERIPDLFPVANDPMGWLHPREINLASLGSRHDRRVFEDLLIKVHEPSALLLRIPFRKEIMIGQIQFAVMLVKAVIGDSIKISFDKREQ